MNTVPECPVCGTPISETRYAEIQEKIRSEERANYERVRVTLEAEAERRVAAATADAERRTREVEGRKLALMSSEKDQLSQQVEAYRALADEHTTALERLALEHSEELKAKEAQAALAARAAVEKELQAALVERNSLSEQLAALELQSLAVRHEHEGKLQVALSEAQRLHADELSRQRAILDQAKADEFGKFRAEIAEQQEALRKKLQEAERKLEQKTAHELGHWPEVNLAVALRQAFAEDEVRPIGKGEPGVDIVHTVRYKGESCGKIVIDSKNRQQWRESFVEKLAQDQINAEAHHAVLSTAVFPQGAKDLCVRKDVILAKPNQVVSVIDLLRRTMISNHILGLSRADEGRKKDRLYQLITSVMYRQYFRAAEKLCEQLQQIDADEYTAHKKVWANRGKLERQLEALLRDINTSMSAIIEGAMLDQEPQEPSEAHRVRNAGQLGQPARLSEAR